MIMKSVTLKPKSTETLETENSDGLKWAVVYKESCVIALFDTEYWAKKFIESTLQYTSFTIREVE